jgi:thymidylate synthase
LQQIIDALKDPSQRTSRRLVMSAWNPCQLNQMALPPCHVMSQFYVNKNRELSCHMYQRSVDVFLGLPFNIASYALLTHLIAQVCDLKVGELVISTGDTHIYQDHVEQVREQLTRTPRDLPQLWLDTSIHEIDKFTMDSMRLENYNPMDSIKAKMAV